MKCSRCKGKGTTLAFPQHGGADEKCWACGSGRDCQSGREVDLKEFVFSFILNLTPTGKRV
jgi:hypothetical protein